MQTFSSWLRKCYINILWFVTQSFNFTSLVEQYALAVGVCEKIRTEFLFLLVKNFGEGQSKPDKATGKGNYQ